MGRLLFLLFISIVGYAHADRGYGDAFVTQIDGVKEISGATYVRGQYFLVSDDNDPTIYQSNIEEFSSALPHIQLKELEGYDTHFENLELQKKIDFEAITSCGNEFYIANEKSGDIFKVDTQKIEKIIFDTQGVDMPMDNKGIEGLAIDCQWNVMYILKQKDPTKLIVVDMRSWKVVNVDVLFEDTNDQMSNVSDIAVYDHQLYLLHKNANIITKYSNTHSSKPKLEVFVDFSLFGDLYVAEKKNGEVVKDFAEAIVIHQDRVNVLYDMGKKVISLTTKGEAFDLDPSKNPILTLIY